MAAYSADVAIAAVNGPEQVVISGAPAAVVAIADGFARRGVRTRTLAVSHAFHSPLMEPMLAEFRRVAETVRYHRPAISLISNVSGGLCGPEVGTADYWVRHVRQAVRFADGVNTLHKEGVRTFVELGPQATLLGALPEIVKDAALTRVASLRSGRDAAECMLEALGELWVQGRALDLTGVFPQRGRRVPLPTYPWQRQRYWLAAPTHPSPAAGEPLDEGMRRLAAQGGLSTAALAALPEFLAAAAEEERADSERDADLTQLFHEVHWQPQPRPSSGGTTAGRWLLLSLADDHAAVDAALRAAGGTPVHLIGAELLPTLLETGDSVRGLLCGTTSGADAVLAILQTLARLGPAAPRCWLLTRGAVGTGPQDRPASPEQAIPWGLGRSFALEHPQAWGGLVDLPPTPLTAGDAAALVAVVSAGGAEDQWALRGDGLRVARLVQTPPPARRRFRSTGTALVTGGLGTLGLHLAGWLARRGVRHLLLTGRRGLDSPGAAAALAALRALGVTVQVRDADVADPDAMAALLADLPASCPLTAVFHLAGTTDSAAVAELTAERLTQALRARWHGTQVLDALTRESALDAFVVVSSLAGVWGASMQAATAAGDAFVDAWAATARAQGRRALAISFGPWAKTPTEPVGQVLLARRGVRALAVSTALWALESALASEHPHVVIAELAAGVIRRSLQLFRPRPLFGELIASPASESAGPSLLDQLAAADPGEHPRILLDLLRQEAAHVLRTSPDRLDVQAPLAALGLDSLLAAELRDLIRLGSGVEISLAELLGQATLTALADQVRAQLGARQTIEPPLAEVPDSQWRVSGPHPATAAYPDEFPDGGMPASIYRLGARSQLEVLQRGRGRRIVLLPPLWSEAIVWKPVLEALTDCEVWALNLPGYGRSQLVPELPSVEALARVVAAVLQAASAGEPLDLVGWSFGGLLAQALAVHHPAQVRTLTLVNTSIYPSLGYDFSDDDVLVRTLGSDLAQDLLRYPERAARCQELIRYGAGARSGKTLLSYAQLVARFDFRVTAPRIRAPTLIVGGARDLTTPVESHSRPLQRAIAGARLAVLPGVGHYLPLFRPKELTQLVRAHLRGSD